MVDGDAAAETLVKRMARDHGLSEGAVGALWDALVRGGGRMAQFSHPELGGMGQWSSGGLLQIGDMFNHDLKARVAAACTDLADAAASLPDRRARDGARPSPAPHGADGCPADTRRADLSRGADDWWPGDLSRPAASGTQNGSRYAYFAERRRLAIERDGRVTLYDTGRHRIFGVSQRQSQGSDLAFTGEDGAISLDGLTIVES